MDLTKKEKMHVGSEAVKSILLKLETSSRVIMPPPKRMDSGQCLRNHMLQRNGVFTPKILQNIVELQNKYFVVRLTSI